MRYFLAFVTGCALLVAAWMVLAFDDLAGATRNPVFIGCFVALGVLAAAFMILARQTPLLVVPGAYILFILSLPFIEHTPVKPALRAVNEIH
jgi:hypothetical protein